MEKLKDYFSRYPQSKEVFENSGVLFHTRGAADSFGNASDTKRYTRNEIEASKENEASKDKNVETTKPKKK